MRDPAHVVPRRAYDKVFHNWLDGYTPCFIDMALLGAILYSAGQQVIVVDGSHDSARVSC